MDKQATSSSLTTPPTSQESQSPDEVLNKVRDVNEEMQQQKARGTNLQESQSSDENLNKLHDVNEKMVLLRGPRGLRGYTGRDGRRGYRGLRGGRGRRGLRGGRGPVGPPGPLADWVELLLYIVVYIIIFSWWPLSEIASREGDEI